MLVREVLVRVSHPHFLQIPQHTIFTEPRRTEAAEDVETAFFSPHPFQNRMKTVAQNIPRIQMLQETMEGRLSIQGRRARTLHDWCRS